MQHAQTWAAGPPATCLLACQVETTDSELCATKILPQHGVDVGASMLLPLKRPVTPQNSSRLFPASLGLLPTFHTELQQGHHVLDLLAGKDRLTRIVNKGVAIHAWPVPTKEEEAVPHSSAGMAPAGARGRAHRAGVVKEGAAGDITVLDILAPVQGQAFSLKALQPCMQRCSAAY